jgi:large subunit ribosomal protein L13
MGELFKQPTKFFANGRSKMDWYLFDAKGKTLGRLASEIAKVLRGKHTPEYTPNADLGDGVIVINAKEIFVSGAKEGQKIYIHHSGYVGGLKEIPYERVKERHPERIIERAVKGMMPKNKLGRAMIKKLRVFAGSEHDMQAQKPITVAI